ncbi:MAG: hypothetical protein H6830_04170 [Planctomycetes bacterium]|nr:hypothetical protein [Planctomycetota bacterium]MCB9910434.1 hypothetical protein [Planctomycetota bacterium]MCB9912560.1 hypothetical protein [Planctomycetota bacterium]
MSAPLRPPYRLRVAWLLSGLACGVLWGPALSAQAPPEPSYLDQGLWREAIEQAQTRAAQESDVATQAWAARQTLEATYRGGDLVGALRLAEAGSAQPDDPYAPYVATRIAVDLDLPERAQDHLERLRGVLREQPAGLDAAGWAWYQSAAQELAAEVQGRLGIADAARAARERARWLVLVSGLAGFGWALWSWTCRLGRA